MSKKYKFILEIPDDMEVDSEYDVDGCVIWPTYSQAEPIKLKGLFDSYEEAKETAEQFKVYNAILYIKHEDGWVEVFHSFDGEYGDPVCFFSPSCADEWVNDHVKYSNNIGYEVKFEEIEILKTTIVAVEE